MTTATATATKFASIDHHIGDTVTIALWLFDVSSQQAQVLATWEADYGDSDLLNSHLLEAEASIAGYINSLAEIDQFTFAGTTHDGWALLDIWQQSPTALADIAADYTAN